MRQSRLSALTEFEDGITIMPLTEEMELKVGELQNVDGKYYKGYVIAIEVIKSQ